MNVPADWTWRSGVSAGREVVSQLAGTSQFDPVGGTWRCAPWVFQLPLACKLFQQARETTFRRRYFPRESQQLDVAAGREFQQAWTRAFRAGAALEATILRLRLQGLAQARQEGLAAAVSSEESLVETILCLAPRLKGDLKTNPAHSVGKFIQATLQRQDTRALFTLVPLFGVAPDCRRLASLETRAFALARHFSVYPHRLFEFQEQAERQEEEKYFQAWLGAFTAHLLETCRKIGKALRPFYSANFVPSRESSQDSA